MSVLRRRAVLVVVLVAVIFAVANAVRPRPTVSTTTTAPPTSSTTTTLGAPTFPAAVGILRTNLTEPAVAGQSPRTLETVVRYPATGNPGGAEVVGATALRSSRPYPLVVFSQGYGINPESYAHLLHAWAAAGYVVVDPYYPFTTPGMPGGLVRTDIVHHPADLSFVISWLLSQNTSSTGLLSALIDPNEIAAIGQSDGGDVTMAVTDNSCCRDSRIKAAVILSGALLDWFPGKYFTAPGVPLLVVQGTNDPSENPVSCSVQLYNEASAPKYYLSMIGQTHESAYIPNGPPLQLVAKVSIDFLNGYLRQSSTALTHMAIDANAPGLATLTSRSLVNPVAGTCPDSP